MRSPPRSGPPAARTAVSTPPPTGWPRTSRRPTRGRPGGWSSRWRSCCRAPCWCGTPRRTSPTPSAPRASARRDTALLSARCPAAWTSPRSSTELPRSSADRRGHRSKRCSLLRAMRWGCCTSPPPDTTPISREGITAMAKVISTLFISADGVAEIDPDWHFRYFDENMGRAVTEDYDTSDVLVIGRETYDSFAGAWPDRETAGGDDAAFAKQLGDVRKIV